MYITFKQLIPYRKEIKGQIVSLLKEIIVIYSDNHKKHKNTLSRQNTEIPFVKAGVTYIYTWVLNVQYSLLLVYATLNLILFTVKCLK